MGINEEWLKMLRHQKPYDRLGIEVIDLGRQGYVSLIDVKKFPRKDKPSSSTIGTDLPDMPPDKKYKLYVYVEVTLYREGRKEYHSRQRHRIWTATPSGVPFEVDWSDIL